jgi:hypothetical protein
MSSGNFIAGESAQAVYACLRALLRERPREAFLVLRTVRE